MLNNELWPSRRRSRRSPGAMQALNHRDRLMQTLAGVGAVTAYTLYAFMPELGSIPASSAAALAGLAPYDRDSGKERGRRRIFAGRSQVRVLPVHGGKSRDPPSRGLSEFRRASHEKGQALQGRRHRRHAKTHRHPERHAQGRSSLETCKNSLKTDTVDCFRPALLAVAMTIPATSPRGASPWRSSRRRALAMPVIADRKMG